jgi:5'(3')-deoxyribonucleotidase
MPEATNILSGLEEEYDITIVSFGETPNLKLKEKWVKEKLPYAKFIGCNFENYPDKSHVDMSGGIFIDDDAHYLESSNAKIKICFGEEYDWNKEWGGIRMKNWYDVREYLKELEVNKDNKSC